VKEGNVIYHIKWKTKDHQKSIAKFQKDKHALPTAGPQAGLTILGSWHAVGQNFGFTVIQTDDPKLLHALTLSWASVLDCEVTQVLSDHEAVLAFEMVGTLK